jgi:FkbM family methyltransferase
MSYETSPIEIKLPLLLRILRRIDFPRKLGICERIFSRKLATYKLCKVRCANGVDWTLDLTDVGHRWMVYGYYEGGVGIHYAADKLKDGGVYVDSGANIGQWMIYLSQLPNVKTFAFEPVPDQRSWLTNCLQNYPGWDVDVIPCALGSEPDVLEIQCAGSRSTFHTQWYKGQDNQIIEVDVDRFDSILFSKGVAKIDFWKLDVEGFEYEALVGAESYLRDKNIGSIYFECHPSNFEKINAYLNTLNYSIYRLSNGDLRKVGSDYPSETENFVAEASPSSTK